VTGKFLADLDSEFSIAMGEVDSNGIPTHNWRIKGTNPSEAAYRRVTEAHGAKLIVIPYTSRAMLVDAVQITSPVSLTIVWIRDDGHLGNRHQVTLQRIGDDSYQMTNVGPGGMDAIFSREQLISQGGFKVPGDDGEMNRAQISLPVVGKTGVGRAYTAEIQ
jgi:hypothetical protein